MLRKILLSIFVCLICLWLFGTGLAYLFRKDLATRVLGIQASDENWAQSSEVQSLVKAVEAWQRQMALNAREERKKALKEGLPYTPPRFDFAVEDVLAKFPPGELQTALKQMSASKVAIVLARVPDETLRNELLAALPADQQENILDWIILRREKEAIAEEKARLLKQKRRMETFQDSLDKQQRSLYELQAAVREEMKEVQLMQGQIAQEFVAIEVSERSKLMEMARTWNERRPQGVAELFENAEKSAERQRLIKILSMMDDDSRANVLDALRPETDTWVTTMLTQLRVASSPRPEGPEKAGGPTASRFSKNGRGGTYRE